MRKALVALMAVACILLGGYYYKLRQQEDNVAPVISFPNVDAIYVEGTDTSVLLDGVTAVDDVDGDVSDTLVVDSVIPMQNQHQATVLYYAKDKSNNVQKTDRIVEYRPADGILWMDETEMESESEALPEETEEQTEEIVVPEGHPKITLTTDAVTIHDGESYNLLSYVKEITDDQDGPDWLYYQIHIDGMNDINGPGVYELYYTVVDREYNQSNRAKLTLTIE
jgi:hypothetical protein